MPRHLTFSVVVVLAMAGICSSVHADTFVVNSLWDGNVADGASCAVAGGTCTLRAAVQQANSLPGTPHVIILPAGVFNLTRFGAGENAAATGDLDIKVDLTIEGAGMDATIIDGLGADRVIDVFPPPAGIQLSIADLTIRNGDPGAGFGGAICNGGGPCNLSIARVRSSGNLATIGGAVYHNSVAGIRTVVDCIFENNSASGGAGGAIYSTAGGGLLSVTGSTFTSQFATGTGGGIYHNGPGALTVDHCSFQQCQSTATGGAVNSGANAPVTISNCDFENNSAGGNGGGVYILGGGAAHVFLTDNRFISNTCDGAGGGCYVSTGGNLTCQGNVYTENVALTDGGGLYYTGAGSVVVESTEFSANRATTATGGGMYSASGGTFALTNSTAADNWASTGGGGFYIANRSQAAVTNSSFLRNVSLGGIGGGLRDSGAGPLTISSCAFADNSIGTSGSGGGAYCMGGAPATIWNSTFSGNVATGAGAWGGALYYNAAPGAAVTNCTFSANVSGFRGGAVYAIPTMTFTNCTFAMNSATGGGASIVRGAAGAITLQNTIVAASVAGLNYFGPGLPLVISGGNNVDQDGSFGLAGAGDQNGVNPLLGPLQNNGGGTRLTHALLGGSPAIDAGGAAVCPGTDERGVGRPQDGNGDGTAVCDIGAVEFWDCDRNGVDDTSEVTMNPGLDCNHNGIPDDCDIARGVLADADGDGIPDICDTCTDTDGDSFGDPGFPANTCPADNCPNTPNPDQADSNHDGVGDACAAAPAASAGPCGVCGLGVGMMMPLMLLALGWMKRYGRRW